jgi:membrane protease YdiL (CAAX protease family)
MHPSPANTPSRPPPTAAERAVLVFALILPTAVTWLYFVALDGAPAAIQQTAYSIGKIAQFALPVVWVFLICRERPGAGKPDSRGLLLGAAFGLLVAGAMLALYFLWLKPSGHFDLPAAAVREKVKSFGVSSLGAFLVLALFYSTVHSLLEEYYWRWFVFGRLDRWLPLAAAIGISSVGFAAHHVLVLQKYFGWDSPLTWLFAAAIAVGGAGWAWLYRRTHSLYATWLSHALVDAAIFAIGYDVIAG